MNSKKLMISITAMSVILVAVVMMFVHSTKPKDPEPMEITADAFAIGTWETTSHVSADGTDHVKLTFDKNGDAEGYFGKYKFEGTWQQKTESEIAIYNNKEEKIYTGSLVDEMLSLVSVNMTDSMTWVLAKK
ncbi:MAG: hypothetical protein IJ132_04710 [Firmicutes bacterium]|nr:hypothetical protein [Bacillota bacterium]